MSNQVSLIQQITNLNKKSPQYIAELATVMDTIKSGNFSPNKVNKFGDNALMVACEKGLEEVALALIETGRIKLGQINKDDNTALIIACYNGLENVALALIATREAYPEHTNSNKDTALITACKKGLEQVALKLIETGKSNPGQVNINGDTALITACNKTLDKVALALINTGQSNPGHADNEGYTALMAACNTHLEQVVFALIKTGQSNPKQVDKFGYTALLYACGNGQEQLAFAIINTGESNPGQVDNIRRYTALLYACDKGFEQLALALIDTGESNPEHVNKDGDTALILAQKNNLLSVIDKLNKIIKPPVIDINKTGFDIVTQENIVISDYLYQNIDNCVFKFKNNYFLSNKNYIITQLKNKANIKYECYKVGNVTRIFTKDSNINYKKTFFTLLSISGIQGVCDIKDIENIVKSKQSSCLYEIKQTAQILKGIISKAYLDGTYGDSADHCQPGKETVVYNIVHAIPICETSKESQSLPEETKEELDGQETKEEPLLTIMYKGNSYKFNIRLGMTIESLKTNMLNILVEKGIINNRNYNVKFIYNGKVITDNAIVLDSLNSNGMDGQTMQLMLSPITGGKRKRKKSVRKKSIRKKKIIKTRRRKTICKVANNET